MHWWLEGLVDSWPSYNIQVTWRRRPALKFKIKCPITGTKVCQLLVIVLSSKSGRVSTTQGTSTGVKAGYTGWFRIRVNHGLTPLPLLLSISRTSNGSISIRHVYKKVLPSEKDYFLTKIACFLVPLLPDNSHYERSNSGMTEILGIYYDSDSSCVSFVTQQLYSNNLHVVPRGQSEPAPTCGPDHPLDPSYDSVMDNPELELISGFTTVTHYGTSRS